MVLSKWIPKDVVFEVDEFTVKSWWWPRRPIVAFPDGVASYVLITIAVTTHSWTQLYFVVASLMFAASSVHHWLTYSPWHHLLDRTMIFWLIALTPVPYVVAIIEAGYGPWFFLGVIAATIGTFTIYYLWTLYNHVLSQKFYVVPFLFGAVSLLGVDLPAPEMYLLLWLGVLLCAANGFISVHEWPSRRSWRFVQHLALYIMLYCHAIPARLA